MYWLINAHLLFCIGLLHKVSGFLWCYSCDSNQPGCGDDGVNWWIHSAINCPGDENRCVKIVERKGANVHVTRDCLSNLVSYKTDIPADTEEGCRSATRNPKLGVYVENEIKELDIKREFWDDVSYCFCRLDQWCNGSLTIKSSLLLTLLPLLVLKLFNQVIL